MGKEKGLGEKLYHEYLLKLRPIACSIRYMKEVPPQKHRLNSVSANDFAFLLMGLLSENPAALLSPLNPTRAQLDNMRFLLNAAANNHLNPSRASGTMQPKLGRPILSIYYETSELDYETGPRRRAVSVVNWDVSREFPINFVVYGYKKTIRERVEDIGAIDFIVLPEQPTSPEQAASGFGGLVNTPKQQTNVGVFANGTRIIINKDIIFCNKSISSTKQYYLIGSFTGEDDIERYWIYGCNYAIHRKTSKQELKGEVPEMAAALNHCCY